ncbi:MAG: hypothetical protein A3C79_01290 [Candidatus Taylorbacteria bacterium RIFCSPHIGHO2_02_FULL_45_28]|nr:MAG: hypothetical protein A3C79_01290 [Candidatus Taylorbacteria bacterium RIFCSPHIGHO2_02_FULL_45_28]
MIKNKEKVSETDWHSGCGEMLGLDKIKQGDTVLVIGSGTGSDCFLASNKTSWLGRVIGVDINRSKLRKAKKEASRQNYKNIEFKLGQIEKLPVEDNSIDVVISHCVINLVPDKLKAYGEIYRVLKKGGKMHVSDVVLLKKLSTVQKNKKELMNACTEGATLIENYQKIIRGVGFIIKMSNDISSQRSGGKLPIARLEADIKKA